MAKKGLLVGLGMAAAGVLWLLSGKVKAAPPPPPPPGLANLYGVVTDSVTGQAISGVLVTLDSQQAYTDSNGAYAFMNIQMGSYTARFSKAGYETRVY